MNRIFVRFFLLVIMGISVAAFVVYFVIRSLFGDPFEEIARKQASGQIFQLEQYVDSAPADEWLPRLNKLREISRVKLDLIPLQAALAALPHDKAGALMRGDVVLDVPSKSFYRRVDLAGDRYVGSAEDVIHAEDLPIDISLELKVELVRYAIVALCLLLPVAVWSRAHWRGLQSLSKVADDFGEGQLSARASIAKASSIYPLAERINQMAGRIENLLEAQKNLMHSVSHELRTPIARLEFGLELLRKDLRTGAEERTHAIEGRMHSMEDDLLELDALVTELLSLTRLDQQAAPHLPFELGDMLRHCMATLDHAMTGKQLLADIGDDLGMLTGDQRLLARAVSNLLANAMKYADAQISVSAHKLKDGGIDITVEDDGPGIPAAERERIFTPFYRLDRSRDRSTGGFGLGLAIAQKAASLHGGSIHVTESALGGAKFILNLPIHE